MARRNTTPAENADSNNSIGSESQQAIVPAPLLTPVHEPKEQKEPIKSPNIALEIGGSHNMVAIQGTDGQWTLARWSKGAGASSLGGGVNVVPTMTALRLQDQELRVKHGYEAYHARTANRAWHLFRYLKSAYASDQTGSMEPTSKNQQDIADASGQTGSMEPTSKNQQDIADASGQTGSMELALKNQQDIAMANGWDIHDIADKFFTFVLEEAVKAAGTDICSPVIWVNIVDYWPNIVAQRLVRRFEEILPGAQIHAVNEVIASVTGAMERSSLEVSEPTSCLYVDCGDTTMNIATLTVNKHEPRFVIHTYDTLELGAGKINAAAENKVRELNDKSSFQNGESRVWETLQFVDDSFKIDPLMEYSNPSSFTELEWQELMEVLVKTNEHLDDNRIRVWHTRLTQPNFDSVNGHIVMQGLAACSITLRRKLDDMLSQEFRNIKVHQEKFEEGSAVMAGLQCVADHVNVTEAPLSLWMRSDVDKRNERDNGNDTKQAVRICRKGQTLNPSRLWKNDRNPSVPIHFTLECSEGTPEIDLSVYGTPTGLDDKGITTNPKGRPPKGALTYAPIASLTLFGQFQKELPLQHREDGSYHAYVFAQITRVGVTMLAVFAEDGHEIQDLESQSVDLVVRDGRLMDSWKEHEGKGLDLIRLGQVARPELSLQPAIPINGQTATSQKRSAHGDPSAGRGADRRKFARRTSSEMIL